jgi:GT2 family glycosyltransferase
LLAVNRGFAETRGSSCWLNPDCGGRGLRPCTLDAGEHRCAIAAPRILNTDGSVEFSARSFPNHLTFLFNRYSLATRLWPGNPWSRRYLLSDWDHASNRSVDWVSGACMLVRRSAIEQVGGMDEAYFMFNEDVDWCHAMKKAGWSVDFVAAAEVTHHIGASKGRVSDKVILERHRMIHYPQVPPSPVLEGLAAASSSARAVAGRERPRR